MLKAVDIKHTTDYHSIMTNFKAKNPDVIFVGTYEEPTALAINHPLDVGYKGKFTVTSDWGVRLPEDRRARTDGGLAGPGDGAHILQKVPRSGQARVRDRLYEKVPGDPTRKISRSLVCRYTTLCGCSPGQWKSPTTLPMPMRSAQPAPRPWKRASCRIIFPNNDVLKNGLMVGAPELILEVKGGQYKLLKEIRVPKNVTRVVWPPRIEGRPEVSFFRLAQYLLNGISQGCVYVLLASGLTIIFGILNVPNFAQGHLYMVAAYLGFYMVMSYTTNYWLALVLATFALGILGLLVYFLVFYPIRNAPEVNLFVAAMALLMILEGGALFLFGTETKWFLIPWSRSVLSMGSIRSRCSA